jgi:hypothetical protein
MNNENGQGKNSVSGALWIACAILATVVGHVLMWIGQAFRLGANVCIPAGTKLIAWASEARRK